jgi:hypothetical protein
MTVAVAHTDDMRWLSWLSVIGLVSAVVLAVIGGFPLDTPMPTHAFGLVEPTCGLTRGSTAIARGDLALAWRYNPASFLVMALGVAGMLRLAVGMTTHRWVNVSVRASRVAWLVGLAAFVGFWVYQQTNAEFIINSRL